MKSLVLFILLIISPLIVMAQDSTWQVMDVNKFKLSFDNEGGMGPWATPQWYDSQYNGFDLIYSGGFCISGKAGDSLWANGRGGFIRRGDSHYRPGLIDNAHGSNDTTLFVLRSSDAAFSESWQNWREAVKLGAYFYDGNGDGVYDPVDRNSNGQWDENEDRPDLLGDITLWSVYHQFQSFYSNTVWGIELRQTAFAWAGDSSKADGNTIFVRYELSNTGAQSDVLDSVYFGPTLDIDIGYHEDDLSGCDPEEQRVFTYNEGDDIYFGTKPAVLMMDLLQGPQSYIPGETYVDNNGNGLFDRDVDTPLKETQLKGGPQRGFVNKPGSALMKARAVTVLVDSDPRIGDPFTKEEINYYLKGGLWRNGDSIDVATWPLRNGSTLGSAADTIDPHFMYSGDPVSGEGWLNNVASDTRVMISAGPFRLEKGNPVEVIVAYTVGHGDGPINSISAARVYNDAIQQAYESNFTNMPTSIEAAKPKFVRTMELYQNYPNPFNPSTTIAYELPRRQHVTISLFDNTGRKVATLIDAPQNQGRHVLDFNAAHLASGVYYYRLDAAGHSQTRKMVLLK